MNVSDISRLFVPKLIFIFNYLLNSDDYPSSILSQHVGKILEINFNDFLLRLIVNKDGIFEVYDSDYRGPSIVITCKESIFKIFKFVNICDLSAVFKFLHISGDMQLMNDMSIVLRNIELSIKDKFYKSIGNFMSIIMWNSNSKCSFSSNILDRLFCSWSNFLANKSIYNNFEDSLQSTYMDMKKIRIRINNLCKNVNCLINIDH